MIDWLRLVTIRDELKTFGSASTRPHVHSDALLISGTATVLGMPMGQL